MLKSAFKRFSAHARQKRAEILFSRIDLPPGARVIDLGGNDGAQASLLFPPSVTVTVCDLCEGALAKARARGFETIHADATHDIPVADKYFDFCFCSSLIEHVTGPKDEMRAMRDGRAFRETALRHQQALAAEIQRISKSYYVQTPYPLFPVESHSWLPAVILLLPRAWLLPLFEFINTFWPKKVSPDWNLLSRKDMARMFPDAEIVTERFLGLSKSLIAIHPSAAKAGAEHRPANHSRSIRSAIMAAVI